MKRQLFCFVLGSHSVMAYDIHFYNQLSVANLPLNTMPYARRRHCLVLVRWIHQLAAQL